MSVALEQHDRRFAEERAAAEARTAPRWIQVQTWPDATSVRGFRWVVVSKPQPPEWWEPLQLGPLPPRRPPPPRPPSPRRQ